MGSIAGNGDHCTQWGPIADNGRDCRGIHPDAPGQVVDLRSMPVKAANRGIALVMTLFALSLLLILGSALVSLVSYESRLANAQIASSQAYYAARAGISRAITELRGDPNWGAGAVYQAWGDASYTVTVTPHPDNVLRNIKQWQVTCVGASGEARRQLVVWLDQESFSRFTYFTDEEKAPDGTTIWFSPQDQLEGEVHTNGFFSFYRNPLFDDRVSSANLNDPMYNSATGVYTQNGIDATDPAKFYHYYSSYELDQPAPLTENCRFSFAGAQPRIPLPTDTSALLNNADAVYSGTVTIALDAAGTMDITSSSTRPHGRPFDPPRGRPTITPGAMSANSATTTVTVPAMGTVYVDGEVYLSGVLNGKLTLGTSGSVHITDSVVYSDRSRDILGIVAGGSIVLETDPNLQKDIEIDAALMALNDSFYVDAYNSGIPRGMLTVFGGVIQKLRGPVGTVGAQTGEAVTGYSMNYVFDPKLVSNPPPNFPSTGRLRIRSWQDRGALGE